jgi:benzoyl-CoA reductase/2-hydroxyglutaryl-CoA dehydratase subunit BcrC/BadD/HgdB
LRKKVAEIDALTWQKNNVSGIDNHIFQVSCSDFDGNVDLFEKKVDQFLLKAQTASEKGEELRLAFIGVPPICPDIYNYLESIGARVVFNEVQRQFAMPNEVADIVTQYQLYTYPYGVFGRLEDIQEEIDKRNIDGVIHYVQSFCYRQIEDMIFREKLNVPLLTIEGDKPGKIDARTKLRIDSFVEMLK